MNKTMNITWKSILAALLVVASLTGCSSTSSSSSSSSICSSSSVSSSRISSPPSSSSPRTSSSESNSSEVSEELTGDATLNDIYAAVKEAYGENYLPNMAVQSQQLQEVYGINTENVDEFIMEIPMISAHVDIFGAFKAKEGKGEEVEQELLAYQDKLVNESLQYPMNQAKVNSSQVVRHGDYVFFVMLGAIDESENSTEEQANEFAQKQTQIAVDTINSFFEE